VALADDAVIPDLVSELKVGQTRIVELQGQLVAGKRAPDILRTLRPQRDSPSTRRSGDR
jgi:hypothetical protein